MDIFLRWICFSHRIAVALTAVLALSGPTGPAPAEAYLVNIVKDTDVKPYQDAVRGFLSACGCTAQETKAPRYDGAMNGGPKPDAMLAVGTNAFRKVRSLQGLHVIHLMVMPSDTAGLPDNISGVSMDISPEAHLASLSELFPRAKKIGVLYDPRNTGPYVAEASEAARRRGIELVVRAVRNAREAPGLLDELLGKIDVYWMLPDPTVVTPELVDYVLLFSIENNIPLLSFSRKYVDMGAVAALQTLPFDMGVQAGEIVKALSAGAKGPLRPYAKTYRLILNRKVAEKMGLRFSPDVIRKAE